MKSQRKSQEIQDLHSYFTNSNEDSFFISSCTSDEVSLVIQYISADLSTLINEPFGSGIFLNSLKMVRQSQFFRKFSPRKYQIIDQFPSINLQ